MANNEVRAEIDKMVKEGLITREDADRAQLGLTITERLFGPMQRSNPELTAVEAGRRAIDLAREIVR